MSDSGLLNGAEDAFTRFGSLSCELQQRWQNGQLVFYILLVIRWSKRLSGFWRLPWEVVSVSTRHRDLETRAAQVAARDKNQVKAQAAVQQPRGRGGRWGYSAKTSGDSVPPNLGMGHSFVWLETRKKTRHGPNYTQLH